MRMILLYLLDSVLSSVRSRAALQLEVIALRHQLEVLQRARPARVRLTRLDRKIWLLLYRLWPRCLDAVVIVKPETVIAWHHKGFRGLCQTNANQVEFVIPGFRWTAQNTCDFQQPLGD